MMRAAVKLRREANKWSEVKNPIVFAAKALSSSMATMAHMSAKTHDDMGDMITTAKTIVADGAGMIAGAKAVISRCSDKRLKADIEGFIARIQTIGVQLKIVASVKATSSQENAFEANAMLVNTAQNLMDTSQHLVRACESAALKLLPNADGAANDIEWTRKSPQHRRNSTNTWYQQYLGSPGPNSPSMLKIDELASSSPIA